MRGFGRGWKCLVGTIAGFRTKSGLGDEIEMHPEMRTEDNIGLGMSV